jgi:hypothetical protein
MTRRSSPGFSAKSRAGTDRCETMARASALHRAVVELDVRPLRSNRIVTQGPDGTEIPCAGADLEVVTNERLPSRTPV